MRITEHVYLVGSGMIGSNLTNEYDCNVYLLDLGGACVLVDSGAGLEAERIVQEMERDGYRPQAIAAILLTHAHADHSGGAASLSGLTGAPVLASATAVQWLQDQVDEEGIGLAAARRAAIYPPNYSVTRIESMQVIQAGQRLKYGNLTIEIIATPGHSADSLSFYVVELGFMFSGDVLFEGGRIAMQIAPDFSFHALSESVERLSGYRINALFPGHLSPLLYEGESAIDMVLEQFRSLRIPPNIV